MVSPCQLFLILSHTSKNEQASGTQIFQVSMSSEGAVGTGVRETMLGVLLRRCDFRQACFSLWISDSFSSEKLD